MKYEVYRLADLPELVQKEMEKLTSMEPQALTKDERAFLKARSSYLRPEQKEIYKEILEPKIPTKTVGREPEGK